VAAPPPHPPPPQIWGVFGPFSFEAPSLPPPTPPPPPEGALPAPPPPPLKMSGIYIGPTFLSCLFRAGGPPPPRGVFAPLQANVSGYGAIYPPKFIHSLFPVLVGIPAALAWPPNRLYFWLEAPTKGTTTPSPPPHFPPPSTTSRPQLHTPTFSTRALGRRPTEHKFFFMHGRGVES